MFKRILLVLISMLAICSGCSKDSFKEYNQVFYNPYIQKLVIYNEHLKDVGAHLFDSAKNQFQYRVDNDENLFIDGNSITNEFRIIKIDNKNTLTEIYKFNKNEGFFPIGKIGEKIYFIHSYYNEVGGELVDQRRIAIFNLITNKLENFPNTFGLIDYGGVSTKYIYYSVYDTKSDTYSIMKIKSDDINSDPKVVKSTVKDGSILLSNDELCSLEENNILCKGEQYKRESVNFIYKDTLVQNFINSNGELCIKLISLKNNEVMEESNIYGIRFENNNIVICKPTGMVTYEL